MFVLYKYEWSMVGIVKVQVYLELRTTYLVYEKDRWRALA